MQAEAIFGMSLGLVAIVSLFVILPWMILHYISKARTSRNLTEDDERMLEDLWRSARTMERRIETLERLVEPDAVPVRPRPTQSTRGDIN
ncbi:MAG: envelope stress response membrane protein PspB [Alphaproteobacteria bacterium 32-64-14]|nr:MAG: envelope stress response membrane protein PspB [Alphaproteobacteria bacterium 32-64-14]